MRTPPTATELAETNLNIGSPSYSTYSSQPMVRAQATASATDTNAYWDFQVSLDAEL